MFGDKGLSEAEISRDIMKAAPEYDCHLFRNNVGMATTSSGHRIQFGLCKGSSDLIGWTSTGRFIAVEVKDRYGRPSIHQRSFIRAAKKHGCIAGVCRSVEDFIALIGE